MLRLRHTPILLVDAAWHAHTIVVARDQHDRSDIGDVRAFLFRAVHNRVIDHERADRRGGGVRTATVGDVQGYRIGEAPVTDEINITISIVDGGDFVLQTTGPVQLVLTG